ncbi:MAG TPA: type I polyketide synthase, partial [Streptosporangiaceae bacterium]|nr:type I polyketide synthase [Streptosporangiaceae bacterium]
MLGDPIEAQALIATYGQDRDTGRPLWLGSVKSNIGHTQQASGAAGVIKTVLALRAGLLPRTLHADEPSPHIDWSAGTVRLLTGERGWLCDDARPRRAGVSAFGMSGTNAHVILEQGDSSPGGYGGAGSPPMSRGGLGGIVPPGEVLPWVVSGRGDAGLRGQAGRLAGFARAGCGGAGVVDVGWSLVAGRSVFAERAVVLAADATGFAAGLEAVAAGEPANGVITGRVPDGGAGKTVFVFPGQGGQWAGMAAELVGTCPAFAGRLAECVAALQPHVDWPVAQVLRGADPDLLERADVVQPVLWAVMVALAAAWESVGVTPDAVAGHSQGEIAAAVVAGILPLTEGARIVAVRSKALARLAEGGAMAMVAWSADVAAERLADSVGRVWVAAVNSPGLVALAGHREALAPVLAMAEAEGTRARWLPVSYASHGPGVDAVTADLARELGEITPGPGRVPFWSAVTGEAADGVELDGAYWIANLREQVRFEQVVRGLAGYGYGVFIEVSPHPVLVVAIEQTLAEGAVVAGTLRRDDGGPGRLLASAAEVFVRGVPVDWAAAFAGSGARRADLPTYAFQRQRYWPRLRVTTGDVRGAGLAVAGHPLLAAAVGLAGEDGVLFTGRWSAAEPSWLGDHVVLGAVLVPGTALVEIAAYAGAAAGCPLVQELGLESPLTLPEQGWVTVQVRVGGPQQDGSRAVNLYSRPDGDGGDGWTRHASGTLAAEDPAAALAVEAGLAGAQWPPADAVPVPVDGMYDQRAESGYVYGPAFRGLAAVWRYGDELLAEVRLPEEEDADASRYAVHPVLLDAALQATPFLTATGEGSGQDGAGAASLLPFFWTGVRVAGRGVRVLRARLRRTSSGVAVLATDESGQVVVSVDELVLRPVSAGALRTAGARHHRSLFGVEWVPVSGPAASGGRWAVLGGDGVAVAGLGAVEARSGLAALAVDGEPVPSAVAAWLPGLVGESADPPATVRKVVGAALALVQEWLTAAEFAGSVLVIATRQAMAAEPGEQIADLACAAVWGLVRSAQSEHPGRFVLADVDGLEASWQALAAAVEWGEPELAIRQGRVLGRRLAQVVPAQAVPTGSVAPDPAGTVLITGGSGVLAGLTARHLAEQGRAGRLLLASRRGPAAPGTAQLAADLAGLGTRVQVAACDAADRPAMAALLRQLPAAHPLTGVFHTAGVLDDGVVGALTTEQLDRVLAPKADAAVVLDELTADRELSEFVLFSSAAATFGAPGQGNYAAANAFLDALAQQRQARGLAATSIAWGMWEQVTGLTSHLGEEGRSRARGGVLPLASAQGLDLLDAALTGTAPVAVAVNVDLAALRAQAQARTLAPLWQGMVQAPAVRQAGASAGGAPAGVALREQLAGLPEERQVQVVLDLIRGQAAAVLGHGSADPVRPGAPFSDLGFDSLTSIELRNRLATMTALRLPATLIFD